MVTNYPQRLTATAPDLDSHGSVSLFNRFTVRVGQMFCAMRGHDSVLHESKMSHLILLTKHDLGEPIARRRRGQRVVGVDDRSAAIARVDAHLEQVE